MVVVACTAVHVSRSVRNRDNTSIVYIINIYTISIRYR